ncbi:MAG: dCMP deaminase [Puniceicoccales bacterium]|jgi:dCMP deaminase|nr:dCMP deaminase [Puniceicoccales bacterium]
MLEDQKWFTLFQKTIESFDGRPSWNIYFMSIALLMAARSSCTRLKVGCVLVSGKGNKNRIIAAGYNGFLAGLPHTSKMRDGHEQATVHAEQNAIADAARRGVSIQSSIVYITHYPCINCAKILLAAGIQHCYYHTNYNNDSLVEELFNEAHVPFQQL